MSQDFSLEKKQIPVNEWGQTANEKVFAGGDIIAQPWTIADAIGSAKRAAIAIDVFLREGEIPKDMRPLPQTIREHLGFVEPRRDGNRQIAASEDMNFAYERFSPGIKQEKLSPEDRTHSFREVQEGLAYDDALEEAKRCLSCGVCRMCGNCYIFYPDGAVYLDAEKGRYIINYDYCKGCGVCHNECPVATYLSHYSPEHVILHPDNPMAVGLIVMDDAYCTEYRYQQQEAMVQAKEVIQEVDASFAEIFGRKYGGLFSAEMMDGAEVALLTLGSMASTARYVVKQLREKEDLPVGLVKLRSVRPFPDQELKELLKDLKAIAVLERDVSVGAAGIVYTELCRSMRNDNESGLRMVNTLLVLVEGMSPLKILRPSLKRCTKSAMRLSSILSAGIR